MASKYVALVDFDAFTAGGDVTVTQAGTNATAWLAEGKIAVRDAIPSAGGTPAPDTSPVPVVTPARPTSYVTLGSSADGMPAFVAVQAE